MYVISMMCRDERIRNKGKITKRFPDVRQKKPVKKQDRNSVDTCTYLRQHTDMDFSMLS